MKTIAQISAVLLIIALVLLFTLKPAANSIRIYSKTLDENRTILVHLPKGYETSGKKYPVLYLLDGGDVKMHSRDIPPYSAAVATLEQLDYSKMPEMILIGIANTDRTRDMIPVKIKMYSSSGGADRFLTFLKDELIPFVDGKYRTTSFRILYGMSDSGLFSVYALLTAPDAFSAYIASSPSLGYCTGLLYKKASELFRGKQRLEKALYIPYCREDTPFCSPIVPEFAQKLEEIAPPWFRWQVKITGERCHIPKTGFEDGLAFIFSHQPN